MRSYNRALFYLNGLVHRIQFVDSERLVHSSLKQHGYMQDQVVKSLDCQIVIEDLDRENLDSELEILKFLQNNSNFCRFAKEVTLIREQLQAMVY